MIRWLFNKVYFKLRGRTAPNMVPGSVLGHFAVSKIALLARSNLMSILCLRRPGVQFRASGVSLVNHRYLKTGRGVTFAEGVIVDAFSEQGIELGKNVTIGRNASLLASGVIAEPGLGIIIGPHTAVGSNNVIWGQGGVNIGRDCLFGPNVSIISENHEFSGLSSPIREQGYRRLPISIGNDCWIGASVVITAGVTIGDGCVVGAGAVITKNIPEYSIAVGVPAKVVGSRK